MIRPTGLIDPVCIIRPTDSQVDDLIGECRGLVASGGRILVTTLTRRMAEDLTEYLHEAGLKVRRLTGAPDGLSEERRRELREGIEYHRHTIIELARR